MPPSNNEDVKYDAESGTYRTFYDPTDENVSIRVLQAVGSIRDVDPTDLEPLDEFVDPDALDSVFTPMQAREGVHGSLSFNYEGLLVLVHSDGEIELREA